MLAGTTQAHTLSIHNITTREKIALNISLREFALTFQTYARKHSGTGFILETWRKVSRSHSERRALSSSCILSSGRKKRGEGGTIRDAGQEEVGKRTRNVRALKKKEAAHE